MSVDVSSLGGSGGGQSQDVELNIASIIDCFTVLITFLLASSAFLSIGIIDAGVAAGTVAAESTAPPPVHIEVKLLPDQLFQLKVDGKISVNKQEARDKITNELSALKSQFPTVTALVLSAQDDIEYKEVILSMDKIRKIFPAVMLGGFE